MPSTIGASGNQTTRPVRAPVRTTTARPQLSSSLSGAYRSAGVDPTAQFAPTPTEDDYINMFNQMLPRNSASIDRTVNQALGDLGRNRAAAADELAKMPAAFAGSQVQSQRNLDSAVAAAQGTVSPDVTGPLADTGALASNLAGYQQASAGAVPLYQKAIQEAYDENVRKINQSADNQRADLDYNRSMDILQLALNQRQQDLGRQDAARARIGDYEQGRAAQKEALASEERAFQRQVDMLTRENNAAADRALQDQLMGVGFEGTAQDYRDLKTSNEYRDALRGLTEGETKNVRKSTLEQIGSLGKLGSGGSPWKNVTHKLSAAEIRDKYGPNVLAVLIADGLIDPETLEPTALAKVK